MRVVALSTDALILKRGPVQDRIISYGTILEKLTIVLFTQGEKREQALSPNVNVIACGGGSKISALFRFAKVLSRTLLKQSCDVVSTQDPFVLGFMALLFSKLRGIPLQVQLHTDCFSRGYWSESPRRALESALASFVISHASCVRAVSERVKKGAMSKTGVPISMLPIFVAPSQAAQTPRPKEFADAFTVLAVARLTNEKQISLLIDAIALLPRTHLVIVGDGPLRKSLESRRAEKGVVERVRFAGWQKDLSPYYQHANCFVQCSRYEGYGMALVEAALSGLPLVTTDVGVVGEMFEREKDALVVVSRAQSVAEAITRIQEDEALRKSLGRHAREKAEKRLLTPEGYLKKYKEALTACVF